MDRMGGRLCCGLCGLMPCRMQTTSEKLLQLVLALTVLSISHQICIVFHSRSFSKLCAFEC